MWLEPRRKHLPPDLAHFATRGKSGHSAACTPAILMAEVRRILKALR